MKLDQKSKVKVKEQGTGGLIAGSAMSGGAGEGAGSRRSEAASGAASGAEKGAGSRAGSGADKGAGSGSSSGVGSGADSTAEGVGAKRPIPDNWDEWTKKQRKNWKDRHWR